MFENYFVGGLCRAGEGEIKNGILDSHLVR